MPRASAIAKMGLVGLILFATPFTSRHWASQLSIALQKKIENNLPISLRRSLQIALCPNKPNETHK
jgi:hypothetical protein